MPRRRGTTVASNLVATLAWGAVMAWGATAGAQSPETDLSTMTMLAHEGAKLFLLLAGLLTLLLALLSFILWGAHFTRRRLGRAPRPSRMGPTHWAAKRFLQVTRYRRPKTSQAQDDEPA
jgi:hypothetical protein